MRNSCQRVALGLQGRDEASCPGDVLGRDLDLGGVARDPEPPPLKETSLLVRGLAWAGWQSCSKDSWERGNMPGGSHWETFLGGRGAVRPHWCPPSEGYIRGLSLART